MSKVLIFTVLAVSAFLIQNISAAPGACSINIHTQTPSPQPVFLRPGSAEFFHPNKQGNIQMVTGDQMELWCPSNWTNFPDDHPKLITIACKNSQTFTHQEKEHNFNDFRCNHWPIYSTVQTADNCNGNKGVLINVGFQIENRWLHLYQSCHDLSTEQNYYVHYKLSPISDTSQKRVARPSFVQEVFVEGIKTRFFKDNNVTNLYTKFVQRQTVFKILGNPFSLANSYIQREPSDVFLSRGHLAAMTDFILASEQQATYHFINVAPQWQTFNGGNWELIEISSRKLAYNRNINLDVWTGTFGVASLKTHNGQWRDIFLDDQHKSIPVPKIYYKILVNQVAKSGVVFIGVNNYHLSLAEIKRFNYIVCTNVSAQINYVTWNMNSLSLGYSYACTVEDFLKKVPHVTGLSHIKTLLV